MKKHSACARGATQTSPMELPTPKTWTALRTEEDENRVAIVTDNLPED